MHNSGTIEARLFYGAAARIDLETLAGNLIAAFADTNIKIRPRLLADQDLAFAVGGLTMSVSRANDPVAVDGIANCKRPHDPTVARQTAIEGVKAHSEAVIIRITGADYVAQKQTRLGICLIATMQVVAQHQPDYLHWVSSNTIYTGQEYLAIAGGGEKPATTIAGHGHIAAPAAHKKPDAWMARSYRAHSCAAHPARTAQNTQRHMTHSSNAPEIPDRGPAAGVIHAAERKVEPRPQRSARPMLQDLLNSLRAA